MSTPTQKYSQTEASEMLTVGELGFIGRHYGNDFGSLWPTYQVAGMIWALERRKPGVVFDWPDVEKMTAKEVNGYFAPEEIELDPEDPETDSGKED